jgi:hypothetical protein
MKWSNLLIALPLLLGASAWCQSEETANNQRFAMGIKLGPMASQMSGDGLGGFDKFGAVVGATVKAKINERNHFSVGIEYNSKGSRAPIDTINHNTFAFRLHYIQIPLQWQLDWNNRLRIHTGLYAAYLANQSVMTNGFSRQMSEASYGPPFDPWDIGATFGIAFKFTEQSSFLIEYGQSVLPIRPNPSQANQFSYYERGNYNSTLALSLIRYF